MAKSRVYRQASPPHVGRTIRHDEPLDTANLTWTAPDDIGGSAITITGYSVQRWNSETSTWDEVATPAASP